MTLQEILLWSALGYLLLVNLYGFAIMGIDKRRSKKENAWRIPEKQFFVVALIGGALGTILGMHHFHHKTKHWYFRFGLPFILVVELLAGVGVWYLLR